jgi:DNA-binding NarL/FixJ family response regulator
MINTARKNLTVREKQILAAVVAAKTNSEIAEQFCISKYAVQRCVKGICLKFGACDRLELVLFAVYHGLVEN